MLDALLRRFGGGPVGLSTLAVAVGEESETVETVCEPFLVRAGLLARTPRGRVATPAAWAHLGLRAPAGLPAAAACCRSTTTRRPTDRPRALRLGRPPPGPPARPEGLRRAENSAPCCPILLLVVAFCFLILRPARARQNAAPDAVMRQLGVRACGS